MTGFYIWIAKHRVLAYVLALFLLFLPLCVLFHLLDTPALLGVALLLLWLFIIFVLISSAHGFAVKRACAAHADMGDPEPLFHVTKQLLAGKLSDAARTDTLINHALALREMGELAAAKRILCEINIDKNPGTIAYTKVVYYNNRYDLLSLLGEREEAEIWYAKMMQIYADMPENKLKRQLDNVVAFAKADYCYHSGEYAEASRALSTVKCETLAARISHALARAELCLKKGDTESAKRLLTEIVQKGGKLYAVTLAKQYLATLA